MESEKLGRFGVKEHNEQPTEVYTKPKLLIHGTVEEITLCGLGLPFDVPVGGTTGSGKTNPITGTCLLFEV
jgi:hypothetical protein